MSNFHPLEVVDRNIQSVNVDLRHLFLFPQNAQV